MPTTFPVAQALIGFGVLLLFMALPLITLSPLHYKACLQPARRKQYHYRHGADQHVAMLCSSCAIWLKVTHIEGKV